MLQFYLTFDSQDCYWMSWKDFQNGIKCNCLYNSREYFSEKPDIW